jgi:hypothetical protein
MLISVNNFVDNCDLRFNENVFVPTTFGFINFN